QPRAAGPGRQRRGGAGPPGPGRRRRAHGRLPLTGNPLPTPPLSPEGPMSLNLEDLTTLERSAHWAAELVPCCRKCGIAHGKGPRLAAAVSRRARSLQAALLKLREDLDRQGKE